jgi:hypothetical protein
MDTRADKRVRRPNIAGDYATRDPTPDLVLQDTAPQALRDQMGTLHTG